MNTWQIRYDHMEPDWAPTDEEFERLERDAEDAGLDEKTLDWSDYDTNN